MRKLLISSSPNQLILFQLPEKQLIDGSDGYYSCPVQKDSRSRVNLPFQIKGGDEALEKKFLEDAKKQGLVTLAGHRTVGGIRASLYNGMPMAGVQALADFMKSFMGENP